MPRRCQEREDCERPPQGAHPQEGQGHRRAPASVGVPLGASTSTRRSSTTRRNTTLAAASTLDEEARGSLTGLKKTDKAKKIGAADRQEAQGKGIEKVVFDRNGFIYHGRIVALADAAREAGLKF